MLCMVSELKPSLEGDLIVTKVRAYFVDLLIQCPDSPYFCDESKLFLCAHMALISYNCISTLIFRYYLSGM